MASGYQGGRISRISKNGPCLPCIPPSAGSAVAGREAETIITDPCWRSHRRARYGTAGHDVSRGDGAYTDRTQLDPIGRWVRCLPSKFAVSACVCCFCLGQGYQVELEAGGCLRPASAPTTLSVPPSFGQIMEAKG